LTSEISKLRDQLSTSQQNEKKLSVSLNEAVNLLQPLQSQIEKVERDKKELQHKLSEARTVIEDRDLGHDLDYANSRNSKGDYEKTINQLNQYVGELEAEVTKLEGKILVLNESSSKDDMRIRLLEKEITALRGEYESTKLMLEDVTATNRSLLNDLRQSEAEELEVIEEFSEAQDMLRSAQEEIENARFIASSLISKMDEINFRDNASSASARSTASGKMRTLTACFRALEDQVRIAAERNMVLENQLSMKNRLISDIMGQRR
jgi:chromosome segregation ATPase